jgi:phosphatidate cytidylyltransferase
VAVQAEVAVSRGRLPATHPPGPRRARHGAAQSRAGRNLPAAVAVGAGLGILILGCLYIVKVAFVGLAIVALVIGVWELTVAFAVKAIRIPVVPVVLGTVAILVGAYAGRPRTFVVAYALTTVGVLLWRLGEGRRDYLRDANAGVLVATYVPFLAGFAVLMLTAPADGPDRVTTFIAVTVCSDIGGYATGVLVGRHPMAPTISPKKSWEGFAGSVLACVGGAAGCMVWLLDSPWWYGLPLGLAVACTATVGDLGESAVKRGLGIKDMGSLLPGHGGIMDRLDSLLPTAPVVWVLLSLMVPTK